MKKILLLVVVFIILSGIIAFAASADVDTNYPCSLGCESLSEEGEIYYCNFDSGTCFQQVSEPAVNETANVTGTAAAAPVKTTTTETKVAALEENLLLLQNTLEQMTSSVSLTNSDIKTIQEQLEALETDLNFLKNNLDTKLSSQQTSLTTGLAGLQESVEKTQQTLTTVQETLGQRQRLNSFMVTALLILLVAGVAGGTAYYVTQKKRGARPDILNYITAHIKQGKKLPQIKEKLLKAGWSEQDIDWAYKETVRKNYQQYKSAGTAEVKNAGEKISAVRKTAPNIAYDPKKIMGVAVVSLLLIVGILFLLRGITAGKAIEFQRLVGGVEGGKAGEITYAVECTPPHTLTPAGDACCLDVDNSTICDVTEARRGQVTGGVCKDNNQCPAGEYCVEGSCHTLASLYKGDGDCTKLCSYYAVKMLTSDGETYSIKPKRGSYTAAGALEWKLLEMPQHCKGEAPIVPINIILKKPGEIISERIITLTEGETSEILNHPDLTEVEFTLTADTIYETCPR
ncbi:MAG: hypothetical protein AABW53_01200 [Nanoarchaeota archaeon]